MFWYLETDTYQIENNDAYQYFRFKVKDNRNLVWIFPAAKIWISLAILMCLNNAIRCTHLCMETLVTQNNLYFIALAKPLSFISQTCKIKLNARIHDSADRYSQCEKLEKELQVRDGIIHKLEVRLTLPSKILATFC